MSKCWTRPDRRKSQVSHKSPHHMPSPTLRLRPKTGLRSLLLSCPLRSPYRKSHCSPAWRPAASIPYTSGWWMALRVLNSADIKNQPRLIPVSVFPRHVQIPAVQTWGHVVSVTLETVEDAGPPLNRLLLCSTQQTLIVYIVRPLRPAPLDTFPLQYDSRRRGRFRSIIYHFALAFSLWSSSRMLSCPFPIFIIFSSANELVLRRLSPAPTTTRRGQDGPSGGFPPCCQC